MVPTEWIAVDPEQSKGSAARYMENPGISDMISIIIPTFNRGHLAVELLDNLVAQNWPSYEIILVDDGSTDDTGRRALDWHKAHPDCPIVLLTQVNSGPAAARNSGLSVAQGEFIYFIDSDDLVLEGGLTMMIRAIRADRRSYCVARAVNTDLQGIPLSRAAEGQAVQHPQNAFANVWMTHAALYTRAAICRAGPFDHALRVGQDSEFQWRIAYHNGLGAMVNDTVALRRQHGFGHLSVGQRGPGNWLATTAALTSFLEKLHPDDRIDDRMVSSVLRACIVVGTQLGAAGIQGWKSDINHLIDILKRDDQFYVKCTRAFLRPENRGFYLIWLPALYAAKGGIRLRRWLKSLRRTTSATT